MGRDKLLDSLDTLVKRLIKLSPNLNRPESSVLNGQGVPINQWLGKLMIFIIAIDEKFIEQTPQFDWVDDVKMLAADVEEILNDIARTKMFEEPSKHRSRFLKGSKGKAAFTVNGDLKTKIDCASRKMATLDDRRREIGLEVRPKYQPCSLFPPRMLEQPPPAQEHEAQVEIPPVQACNDREPSSRPEKRRRLDEDSEGTIQGQVSNTTSFMSEPLSGTRRIKTDSNPEILDSEDDIEIS